MKMSLKNLKSLNIADFIYRASQKRLLHKNYQNLQKLRFSWGKKDKIFQ